MANFPDIGVARKILSSEYQLEGNSDWGWIVTMMKVIWSDQLSWMMSYSNLPFNG
jgi:hypothetical protein